MGWMVEVAGDVLVRAKLEDEGISLGTKGGEAGVELGEIGGGRGDNNAGKAFAVQFGLFLAISHGESGRSGGAMAVEEVGCSVGDRGVA